ncbi:unnamed protein product [Mytilus edulis]|uniref:Fibrinogen C-terminal domain-containing protein n=1 Tax=Mytilus edulis TaxID=6550 RepID=A0A8S3VL32_MYTED|nr:unnamed protein product [Mytilus edulis]
MINVGKYLMESLLFDRKTVMIFYKQAKEVVFTLYTLMAHNQLKSTVIWKPTESDIRYDGSVEFYNTRTWTNYKYGFGNLNGEFWLGLEYIYQMTMNGDYKLRVDLEDNNGVEVYAEYSTFRVNSEADLYRLIIAGYSGTAGEGNYGMLYNHNTQFSSPDNVTACTSGRKGEEVHSQRRRNRGDRKLRWVTYCHWAYALKIFYVSHKKMDKPKMKRTEHKWQETK